MSDPLGQGAFATDPATSILVARVVIVLGTGRIRTLTHIRGETLAGLEFVIAAVLIIITALGFGKTWFAPARRAPSGSARRTITPPWRSFVGRGRTLNLAGKREARVTVATNILVATLLMAITARVPVATNVIVATLLVATPARVTVATNVIVATLLIAITARAFGTSTPWNATAIRSQSARTTASTQRRSFVGHDGTLNLAETIACVMVATIFVVIATRSIGTLAHTRGKVLALLELVIAAVMIIVAALVAEAPRITVASAEIRAPSDRGTVATTSTHFPLLFVKIEKRITTFGN